MICRFLDLPRRRFIDLPRCRLDRCGDGFIGLQLRHPHPEGVRSRGWFHRFWEPNCRGDFHNLYCLISLSETTILS
uniref:Uncharacterized protein n=1 Tax=Triticum urartu TaxID=4572 RepID=A0A8R7TT70_TRIUA